MSRRRDAARKRAIALGGLVLAAAGLAAPSAAAAPYDVDVRWPADTSCMTVVDRSADALLHLEYGVVGDVAPEPDEMPGGMLHQFFAFCDDDPTLWLPPWITRADVEAYNAWSLAQGGEAVTVADEDVLETSSIHGGCFFRITPDDARRPILTGEAALGVDWDTSSLAPGPHVVRAYTWRPPYSTWSSRPGVVHVVDGPELDASGPAVALIGGDEILAPGNYQLRGCVRAANGSRLSAWWSSFVPEWHLIASDVPITGDSFALPFELPPGVVSFDFHVEVVDPGERRAMAHLNEQFADWGAHPPGPTTAPSEEPAASDGCACASGGASGGSALLLLVGLGARRRKRGFALGAV